LAGNTPLKGGGYIQSQKKGAVQATPLKKIQGKIEKNVNIVEEN
jgi:hypothetical protein